jgi:glutamine phosphoribosylpyrophosphate amidotransferase
VCIAIVIPAGKRLTRDQIRSCISVNPDGAGIAYISKGRVRIKKGLFTEEQFCKLYNSLAEAFNDSPMLVHFRIQTVGKIVQENCHPFRIRNGALIHNGTLWAGSRDGDKSDTREFADMHGDTMTPEFVNKHIDDLSDIVGFNKIAFLWKDGRTAILNQRSWKEDDGIWFSNDSYKSSRYSHWGDWELTYGGSRMMS